MVHIILSGAWYRWISVLCIYSMWSVRRSAPQAHLSSIRNYSALVRTPITSPNTHKYKINVKLQKSRELSYIIQWSSASHDHLVEDVITVGTRIKNISTLLDTRYSTMDVYYHRVRSYYPVFRLLYYKFTRFEHTGKVAIKQICKIILLYLAY